jgi:hypothetical protein
VQLPWGRLFCVNDAITVQGPAITLPWDQIEGSVMTSMVITLDIIKVVGDVVIARFDHFNKEHFYEYLSGLEVLYWHARSFNGDKAIRVNLFRNHFMVFPDDANRYPHLLEQEVFSLSKILEISLAIYSTTARNDLAVFAEDWVHRYVPRSSILSCML